MNYRQIKRLYGLEDKDIAKIFGYKSVQSFTSSTAKPRLERAVELLHEIFTHK